MIYKINTLEEELLKLQNAFIKMWQNLYLVQKWMAKDWDLWDMNFMKISIKTKNKYKEICYWDILVVKVKLQKTLVVS
jgi:hypothetical protein